MFDLVAVVLEVRKEDRTARATAKFESHAQAEVSANAMNEMVKADWYKGDKDVIFQQVHHDRVRDWGISYGYLIIE